MFVCPHFDEPSGFRGKMFATSRHVRRRGLIECLQHRRPGSSFGAVHFHFRGRWAPAAHADSGKQPTERLEN